MPNIRILLALTVVSWGAYPGNIFAPRPSSLRPYQCIQTQHSTDFRGNVPPLEEWRPIDQDSQGRPSGLLNLFTGWDGLDSIDQRFTWGAEIPPDDNDWDFPTPTQVVEKMFYREQLLSLDTMRFSWNPTTRVLVATSRYQESTCRWTDSVVYDTRSRIVSRSTCDTAGIETYRAWFTADSDSLPVRESSRLVHAHGGTIELLDSIHTVGPANRPDTLIWQSGILQTFTRDGASRITKVRYSESDHKTYDSTSYTYDSLGRLARIDWGAGDTSRFAYPSESTDAIATRTQSHLTGLARFEQNRLVVELPASDRIRIEPLGLEGRRTGPVFSRLLPAGRTELAVPPRSRIVRISTSSGRVVLPVPALQN